MNLIPIAVMVLTFTVVIVDKPETVQLSQSSTNATVPARQNDPSVTVTEQDDRKVINPAGVWEVPRVFDQLDSVRPTLNAALNPGIVSTASVAAEQEVVLSRATNSSVHSPPTSVETKPTNKQGKTGTNQSQTTN
jgi:hypothetical protein